ncbi:MAG: DUF6288 domain-containing protein [Verrucomicrobia bacterium]|nr:DUF6288 domain-containing protein [Verrucomicrobiota bacterium]
MNQELPTNMFEKMKNLFVSRPILTALWLTLLLMLPAWVQAAPPDLTAAGVIATIDRASTYNLGPTGLRGWIHISSGSVGADGLITGESRQILVTIVGTGTPAAGVLAVDDVILGVSWGTGSDPVPLFTSDARKSFGWAIGEAEKTANSGILRLKRWRGGVTADVSITLPVMGSYTDTAPNSCPKSALILANARTSMVSQLLANPSFLTNDYAGAIKGLALLAGVAPGDPNYATVQTRLQTYARALAATPPNPAGLYVWDWGYIGVFLGEYYLSTNDANVVTGINHYTVALAKVQSRYGTYGHGGSLLKADGTLHGTIPPYGPVNQAGIPANIAIVIGRKALVAAGQAIDPEIDPAIQRGSDFFAWYANKGPIPYGEHEPFMEGHSPNGKDALCAVLFGLQDKRLTETEYFARMTTAGFNGREYGHTGQGFSYLWGAMGANMGGALAVAEYLKPVRWHLDLERRSDGSFVYDGGEQYGAGTTADGTYLGASGYYDINPTASYILTYALPLQRLCITGKNAIPANSLDASKVANAIAAATFNLDCPGFTTTRLIAALSEFDPVVRNYAAIELAKRSLTTAEVNTLLAMVNDTNANARQGACQTLGILKNATALPLITQRLSDPDSWVRAKAATALRSYGSTASTQRDPMLTAFTANATDPDVIVWDDPIQISNGYLGFALFGDAVYGGNNIATYTINASKSLLYPAVQAGLKQPDSKSRLGVARFSYNYLTLADVQALIPDLFEVIETESQADTMWSMDPRGSGIATLAKYKISEGIPLALAMQEVPTGFGWGSDGFQIPGLNALAAYGDAARWALPTLRGYLGTWDPLSSQYTTLVNTITTIENAITAPTLVPGLAVANPQVVATTGAKAITLTGTSPRTSVTFANVTVPAHGTLSGTAPNLIYTPAAGYPGPDHFSFQVTDGLTTSEPGTVSIIVGTAGTGLKGEYFDNLDFTNLKLTRTDAQVNFDWGTGSPNAVIGADTFSVRWSGLLLVPETGTYRFSTLNSDGVRSYLNGVPVIDDYVDQTTNWKDGAAVNLTAGQMVDLQLEYYENTGSAVAKLKWTGPSFAGDNGAIIAKEWLFDGTGVTNRTPYAHAQSLTLVQNTAQAITLTGSGGTLIYSVITQPAHGSLTGTAPNLTYTPAANYSGADSFTFLVNNGTSNSAPATVSIGIWAGQPTDFFWTTAVSGNWSGATTWSNAAGATAVPAATGQAFYRMSCNKSGTYTATQDLNNGFLLNQLNVAGAVTLAGTNSLAFAANGTLLPQFNQNSTNAVTINAPVSLTAMTTFGGTNGGQVDLASLISGSGGLTKDNAGMLKIHGLSPNTYSGGTIVNSGTLHLGTMVNDISPLCQGTVGTGTVTLNSGTIEFDRVTAANTLTVNGGTLFSNNGWGATWSGPVALNATATINAAWNMAFSGNVSGAGGFTKTGSNTLTLSGTNSFTGANRITAGTLTCSKSTALGTGSLDITTGAKVTLNYTGTRTITALTFNAGVPVAPGTYGSTASPATNKNDAYFSGTGTVTILPATTTALALTVGSTPSNPGTPLTFTAAVTGSTPTGNVAFYAGPTLLGTSALNGSYQASLTTSSLAIGSYHITAQYAGNTTNAASTSAALAIEITSMLAAPPTNLLAAPGNNHVGLTWTVSAGATGYYVKRSLTNGGAYTVIGNPNTASYDDPTAANGTTYYYVVSAINAAGESANSSQVSAIPAVQRSTTTLVSSPVATGSYGDAVTFTATVTVFGGPATGTVTFRDGTTELGIGTLSSGTATFATSTLAVANHSVTASFGGDATFAGSVSAPLAYVVTAKALTITGITATNKVYDKTDTATLTGGTVSSGLVGSETVTVVPGSGTFASPSAGTWAVTATGYALGGAYVGNYVLSAQPTVPNATITPRPLQLAGTRTYDGTATAAAGFLTVPNNLDGTDLSLSGSATLAAKDAGMQGFLSGLATPVRVQSNTGSTGSSASTTVGVNLTANPLPGNTLVAVISTRGTSTNRVSAISGGGVTWSRVSQAAYTNGTSGTTTEIWYGPNVTSGTTGITITQASLRSAAVVIEYSGLLAPTSLDMTANNTGSSTAANTGTTATTTQPTELWLGGIGIADGRRTLNVPYGNAFTVVAFPKSGTANSDAMIYALEKIVSTTGTAGSGGTVSTSDAWAGAIATFKAASTSTLTLTGTAAANYTLSGLTGSVAITPKNLTASGLAGGDRPYDGTAAAVLTGAAALLPAQAAGSGIAADGKPYTGDNLTLGGTATGAFADKHAGDNKTVTVTGITLAGAQKGNYTLIQPAGLTANVTVLPLTVAAVSATKTHDGTTAAAGTPTLTPTLVSGDTASVLSQAFQNPTAGAGNKVIIPNITINDGNGGANYAVTLTNCTTGTIDKATATVTLGGLAQTYDGSPRSATATTDPIGKSVNFTYDGSSIAPIAAGSYAVIATIDDPNYSGTATGILVIAEEPLVAWRDGHFSAAEISAGLAADHVDADGDGFTNLAEYTLGTDPRSFSPQPLAIAPAADNHFTLSFVARRATGAGYDGCTRKYTVEGSADPANPTSWQPVTGYTNIDGDDQTVEVTLPAIGSSKFYRLYVRVE